MMRRLLGDPILDVVLDRTPDWLIRRAAAYLGICPVALADLAGDCYLTERVVRATLPALPVPAEEAP